MRKERAASATKHGLPVASPPLVHRPKSAFEGGPALSAASRDAEPPNARMPLAVKLLGLGLALLGALYGLTRFRDREPTPQPERIQASLESEAAILAPSSSAANRSIPLGDSGPSGVAPAVAASATLR
jgi:hypothetical protein